MFRVLSLGFRVKNEPRKFLSDFRGSFHNFPTLSLKALHGWLLLSFPSPRQGAKASD